jgi:hypothetical protein
MREGKRAAKFARRNRRSALASFEKLDLDLERVERDAYADIYKAAPEAVRASLGLECRAVADGVLLLCRGIDHIQFNRLAGVGIAQLVSGADLDSAIQAFEQANVKNWIVPVPPAANDLRNLCVSRGLRPHSRSWARFQRDTSLIDAPTRLTVQLAKSKEADAFGATAAKAFGLPAIAATWLAALVDRPGWYCFLGTDGTAPAATGALYVDGDFGWLGIGSTLPESRRSGGQSAILAARIAKAAELGCTHLTTETGVPHPGEKGPSFANIQRAGFSIAYVRENFTAAN